MAEQNSSFTIKKKNCNKNSSSNLVCDIDCKKRKINDTIENCQINMQSDYAVAEMVIKTSVNDVDNVNDIDIDEPIEEKKILTIDVLNYDCLAKVFSYLSICERLDAEKGKINILISKKKFITLI